MAVTPTHIALWTFGAVFFAVLGKRLRRYWDYMVKLSLIPTVGHSGVFSSYITGFKFVRNGTQIIQEGYRKYPGQAFKVAMLDRWHVIVSGADMINDLRKAEDDQLSMQEAFRQLLHTDMLLGNSGSQYHIDVIQGALTRNLGNMFSEVYDEIVCAFNDELPLTDDWVKVPTLYKTLDIVCRTSNRLFVGLPLCRNKDWIDLNINFTIDFFTTAGKCSLFPQFLQPLVAWYINSLGKSVARANSHLGPIIRNRLERVENREEDLENDLVTWLVKVLPGKRYAESEDMTKRILTINMAAIHTTSQALTHALINIAAHPEYITPLRAEMEKAISEDGWSKAAMGKMRMLDSFLKESQRVSSSGASTIRRVALRDFVFSNGTVIPAGTLVATSPSSLHFDETLYADPHTFDGFRSYKKRSEQGESMKHQMVTPGVDYVAFGAGKHACPGRFFAVNELKALFAHTLLHYDIKLDEADAPPKTETFSGRIQSNSKTQVMLRKRKE
ncbi:cytochrome P450 [Marasmius fiardii PR-910]|nr:cytochrome P450 [Marasmius fiardii PR-910]